MRCYSPREYPTRRIQPPDRHLLAKHLTRPMLTLRVRRQHEATESRRHPVIQAVTSLNPQVMLRLPAHVRLTDNARTTELPRPSPGCVVGDSYKGTCVVADRPPQVGKCLAMFRPGAKDSGQENRISFPLEESAGLMLARGRKRHISGQSLPDLVWWHDESFKGRHDSFCTMNTGGRKCFFAKLGRPLLEPAKWELRGGLS